MFVCVVPRCGHSKDPRIEGHSENVCKFFRFPKHAEERARWISNIGVTEKQLSGKARVCSCHFAHGLKVLGPTIFDGVHRDNRSGRENGQEPPCPSGHNSRKSIDNVISRLLPPETTCLPTFENMPRIPPVGGLEIFSELMEIMQMKERSHIIQQELLQRFKTLKDIEANRQKTLGGEAGRSGADGCSLAAGEQNNEPADENPDALLVLRPELLVPELRDLPTLHDLHTVPTTLTEATRMIFALRKDMMRLLNGVLQRSLLESTRHIEKARDHRAIKQQRLLDRLGEVFTEAQLSKLREDGKTDPWGAEDYLRAISLRRLCRHRAFEFVRNTMQIPLPSMLSVRSVASSGRFPEVTKRYKELGEHKKLTFKRSATEKSDQSDTDAVEDIDTADTQVVAKREVRDGDVSRGVKRKRKAQADTGSAVEPSRGGGDLQRPCWNAVNLPADLDPNYSSGEERWSGKEHLVLDVAPEPDHRSRGSGRKRGRGWRRAGRQTERPAVKQDSEDARDYRDTQPPARASKGRRARDGHGAVTFSQEVPDIPRKSVSSRNRPVGRNRTDRGRPSYVNRRK